MSNTYIYLLVMCLVLYGIRLAPFLIFRKEIKNVYIRSFLTYVPYVTLAVMTFPAIMYVTDNIYSGIAALVVGLIVAWLKGNLMIVASACCLTVLVFGAIF